MGIAAAISACIVYSLAVYFVVRLGGDALMEYDIVYYIANHEIKHGEPAFWNPYLYAGQQVQPGFHMHYVFSIDAIIAKLLSILHVAIPYAIIYSASRLVETLLLLCACLLIGRELKLGDLASSLCFLIILLSFPLITQSWPFDIVFFGLWTTYFILRAYRSPSWLNVSFLAASAVSLLMGAKIIGFIMMEIPLLILGAGLLGKIAFLKRAIPIGLLASLFVLTVHGNFKLYEDDNFYGGRTTGGYLSSSNTEQGQSGLETRIKNYQTNLDAKSMTISALNPLTVGKGDEQFYIARDIGGYFGVGFLVLFIYLVSSLDVRNRRQLLLFGAAVPLFLYAIYPGVILWLPDGARKLIDFRYYNFSLGPLKVILLFLGALALSTSTFSGSHIGLKKISLVTSCAAIAMILIGQWPLALATAALAAGIFLCIPTQARMYVILSLIVLELFYVHALTIALSRPDIQLSHRVNRVISVAEKNNYEFHNLQFHIFRQNNSLGHTKFPNQLPAHQKDVPLPIKDGHLVAGFETGAMPRCLKAKVDEARKDTTETSELLDWIGVTRPVFRWLNDDANLECARDKQTAEETYMCGNSLRLTVQKYTANKQSFTIESERSGDLVYSMHDDNMWRVRVNGQEYRNDHSCFFKFSVDKGLTRIDMKYQNTMLKTLHYSGLFVFGWLLFGIAYSVKSQIRLVGSYARKILHSIARRLAGTD